MTDPNPSQRQPGTIADEFIELGRNIQKALQAAWASEDRKKLQAEIEAGLKEAGNALKQATDDFSSSPAAQTLKSEAEDLHNRVKSGELEDKIRSEVLAALRMANEELKKAFPVEPPPSSGKS